VVLDVVVLDVPLCKCQVRKVAPVEAQPTQGALDSFVSAQAQEGNARGGAEETDATHRKVPACYHWSYVKRYPRKAQSETRSAAGAARTGHQVRVYSDSNTNDEGQFSMSYSSLLKGLRKV